MQKSLKIKKPRRKYVPEFAESVGLSFENETVTLRFLGGEAIWGQAARQVKFNRKLAEELSRLLNYELDSRQSSS